MAIEVDNKWGLNENQRNFCDYYLQTRNARQSYKKAYAEPKGKTMNDNTASVNSTKLLQKENVQAYLKDRKRVLEMEEPMEEEEIILELNKIALDTAHTASARLKAFELLGKQRAMWIDKNEIDGNFDIEINLTGLEKD